MDGIRQIANVAHHDTNHIVDSSTVDILFRRTFRTLGMETLLKRNTIAGHIYVEFIAQAIYLFRCHTTVAEPDTSNQKNKNQIQVIRNWTGGIALKEKELAFDHKRKELEKAFDHKRIRKKLGLYPNIYKSVYLFWIAEARSFIKFFRFPN